MTIRPLYVIAEAHCTTVDALRKRIMRWRDEHGRKVVRGSRGVAVVEDVEAMYLGEIPEHMRAEK